MILYLESSAALRDVLEGDQAAAIRADVEAATLVATSRLTLIEIRRVIARLRDRDPAAAARVAARESALLSASEGWAIDPIDEAVWERCARAFPSEPVRTLDAIHLATLEKLSGTIPGLTMLSTDERVRRNARALGFAVRP